MLSLGHFPDLRRKEKINLIPPHPSFLPEGEGVRILKSTLSTVYLGRKGMNPYRAVRIPGHSGMHF